MSYKVMRARERDSLCAQCESPLVIRLTRARAFVRDSGAVLECAKDPIHEGIESVWAGLSRRKELEAKVGTDKAVELRELEGNLSLTKQEAGVIIKTIWPGAPEVQTFKAVNICHQYGLNPLMGHVFLVKYDRYNKNHEKTGEDWVTVLGIKATRLIAARRHPFSYIDDTPRLMTPSEEKAIFGEVDPTLLKFITKLQDMKTGAEAVGYGSWPKDKQPLGVDKGNSKANMGMIRSERAAIDRIAPAEMLGLAGVPSVDEEFVEPTKITVEKSPPIDQPDTEEPPAEGVFHEEPEPGTENQRRMSASAAKEANAATAKPTKEALLALELKNAGSFYQACNDHFKINKSKVDPEIAMFDLTKADQRKKAWQQIVEAYWRE